MELAKVEILLERYFEGETSLKEEQQLRDFFQSEEVPSHLAPYTALFKGLTLAQQEKSTREVVLPEPIKRNTVWIWSIAASLVIALGIGSLMINQSNGLTQEEQEALAAYQEAKQTMLLLSENLNKGASKVNYLNTFTESTSNMKYINEFAETKKRILK